MFCLWSKATVIFLRKEYMARSRESKKNILEKLEQNIGKSKSFFFANLKGLTVKQTEDLRASCRKEGIDCLMAKKTLLNLAFKNKGINGVDPKKLEGEVALAFGYGDEIAPARILASFAKTHETFGILGGVMVSQATPEILDAKKVQQLAKLPSREELLGSLVGSLACPMRGFVSVLQGNMRGLVQALKGIADMRSV
jgi:large subunit ribosomal protein L10